MSVLHRTSTDPDPTGQQAPSATAAPPDQDAGPPPAAPARAARTRTSAAWVSIWAATGVLIALIVFILQNTRRVQVSFLGLHGTLPLSMALLIAAVGAILLTLVFGTARITQLRRRLSRARRS